jgi:NAD(P)H-hydrate epimerase
MRILGAAEAAAIDDWAVETLDLATPVLMETAAISAAELAERLFPAARRFALICGTGNNGGDGLALARHLLTRGHAVEVFVCGGAEKLGTEAQRQRQTLRALAVECHEVLAEHDIAATTARIATCDLVVDALFGTGLSRPIEGWRAGLVEAVDLLAIPKLALDLPSGLFADGDELPTTCLRADATVTFFGVKRALVWEPAATAAGDVYVAELGVPAELLPAHVGEEHLLAVHDLTVPQRPPAGHKGSFGHLAVVAGSPGKSGAAVLAARAALRSGVGLVTVATPAANLAEVESGCVESMTSALPPDGDRRLGAAARMSLEEILVGKSAVAIGPGLGGEEQTAEWIRAVVVALELPCVLDADALNAYAGRLDELAKRPGVTVLTPHPGEMARLLGGPVPRTTDERLAAARQAANSSGCVVVLKGSNSLIATPRGELWVNPSGNAGMATAGSGDVLTGAIGAWLAQGLEGAVAARLGVYLHGLAGDLAVPEQGEHGLIAGDLLELLPKAMQAVQAYSARPRRGLLREAGRSEVAELLARVAAEST